MPKRKLSAALDTNVVLDYLDSARPEHAAAVQLLRALVETGARVCLPASALTDIYYLMRRASGESVARRAIGAISEALSILPVDADICRTALKSDEPGFEDGIVRACAEAAAVDWLITRDAAAFANSTVAKITPAGLNARLAQRRSPRRPQPSAGAPSEGLGG
jgi:predicted nucleic acid-binding protein